MGDPFPGRHFEIPLGTPIYLARVRTPPSPKKKTGREGGGGVCTQANLLSILSNPFLGTSRLGVVDKIHYRFIQSEKNQGLGPSLIVQFKIRRSHWIKAQKIYLYRVSLDLKLKYSQIPARRCLNLSFKQWTHLYTCRSSSDWKFVNKFTSGRG